MKKIVALLFGVMCLLPSCKREPLYNLKSDYLLKVKIDTVGALTGFSSQVMSVNFYDVETDKVIYNTFGTTFEQGDDGLYFTTYLSGFTEGKYKMLIYNYGTATTRVEETQRWSRVYARTNLIDRPEQIPIVYAPDHLYVASEPELYVPSVYSEDDTYVIESAAKKITSPYKVEIRGIHNINIATSITIYISGQITSAMLCDGEKIQEEAILAFGGSPEYRPDATGGRDSLITATFCTFGNYNNSPKNILTLVIATPNGATYYGQADVGPYLSDENLSRIVPVDFDITLKPREDGGVTPTTDEWNEEIKEIEIN